MIAGLLATGAVPKSSEQQHEAGRSLLLRCLWQVFGVAGFGDRIVAGRFGKPVLKGVPDIHFSVSHVADAVVAVVSDAPVGVDVERVRPRDPFAASRMLHPREARRVEGSDDPDREFFRCWTLKESYVKALGTGLAYPMRTLIVSARADGEPQLNRPGAVLSLNEQLPDHIIATCRIGEPEKTAPLFEHVDGREWEELGHGSLCGA